MAITIKEIKKLVIIALASDEELMETLVLKGGNAIEFLRRDTKVGVGRASYDMDFSMADDFGKDLEDVKERLQKTIERTFAESDLAVFDYKFMIRPSTVNEKVKDFWGGYKIEFKITTREQFNNLSEDLSKLRRTAMAIVPGGSTKIEIEISKFEYTADKITVDVDGYTVYVYSEEMIVFEKLRAICQQLPAYGQIIPSFSPRPRARDFYDIHLMMDQYKIDPTTAENKEMIKNIFAAKRVPLDFIQHIQDDLEIHRQDWQNVIDTLSGKEDIKEFDFYVDFVLKTFQPITFP